MSTAAPAVPQAPAPHDGSRAVGRRRFGWPHALLAAALVAGGVYATSEAWHDIVRIARRDEEQSHVLLVPLVVGWLVWVRIGRLRRYVPEATWAGPVVVAAGWALHRAGDVYLIQSMWHLGAILVALGGLLTVVGAGVIRHCAPAFAALLFLVPVPGTIRQDVAIPLQAATADVTQTVLETMGVVVERSGNVLRINSHDVMIAEACNGVRMAFALLLVSYAFVFGAPLRGGFRVAVILASPVTAIVFNVARLVPTVWAFGILSPGLADTIHEISGWIMLPCAFFALVGLMRLLRWAQIPITHYVLAHGS